jgi:hypothetical protein
MIEENSDATTTIGSNAPTTKKANRFNCNDVRQERINNKAHSTKSDPYLSRKVSSSSNVLLVCRLLRLMLSWQTECSHHRNRNLLLYLLCIHCEIMCAAHTATE